VHPVWLHVGGNEGMSTNREVTLQILIRGVNDPALPRNGQPKLVMCLKKSWHQETDCAV
jgi:hypothetical protein